MGEAQLFSFLYHDLTEVLAMILMGTSWVFQTVPVGLECLDTSDRSKAVVENQFL